MSSNVQSSPPVGSPGARLVRGSCADASDFERPDEGVFVLPGGYVDDEGARHAEVELEPLTGHDEELLAAAQVHLCTARVVTTLLSRRLRRVGTLTEITLPLV